MIKNRRIELGKSAEEVARRSRMSVLRLSEFEEKRSFPSYTQIENLARTLQIDFNVLWMSRP